MWSPILIMRGCNTCVRLNAKSGRRQSPPRSVALENPAHRGKLGIASAGREHVCYRTIPKHVMK